MSDNSTNASWGSRLAAVSATLLSVVVVFAVKFSANGNEMNAVMAAAMPIGAGLLAAFIVGLIGRFAIGRVRWKVYTYVLLAVAVYLIAVEFL